MKLLGVNSDTKTTKGTSKGFLTGILYLIPNDALCPNSINAGCREGCLVTSGLASIYKSIPAARLKKTEWFENDYASFMVQLCKDIDALIRKAGRLNMVPCVRLNGTSDIDWQGKSFTDADGIWHRNIMAKYPAIQFYDYTKMPRPVKEKNYHLTFSYSANPDYAKTVKKMLKMPNPIAVVFATKNFPATFLGRTVVDGDATDLRFLDADNVIVGLKAKGKMRKGDTSGMVVKVK